MSRQSLYSKDCLHQDQTSIMTAKRAHNLFCICCLNTNVPFINLITCNHSDYLDNFSKPELKPGSQVVCSYCHVILKKIQLFKQLVQGSFNILSNKAPTTENLNQRHNLQMHKAVNIEIPYNLKVQSTLKEDQLQIIKTETLKSSNKKYDNIQTALDIIKSNNNMTFLAASALNADALLNLTNTLLNIDILKTFKECNDEVPSKKIKLEPSKDIQLKLEPSKDIQLKLEPSKDIQLKLEPSKDIQLKLEPSKDIQLKLEPSKDIQLKLEPSKDIQLKLEPSKDIQLKLEPSKDIQLKLEPSKDIQLKLEPSKDIQLKLEPSKDIQLKSLEMEAKSNQLQQEINKIQSSSNEIISDQNEFKQESIPMKLKRNQLQPDTNKLQTYLNQLQPGPNELQPDPNQLQPDQNQLQPDPNELQQGPNELQTDPNQLQPDPNELQPDQNELQPNPNELQLVPNQLQPQSNQMFNRRPTIPKSHRDKIRMVRITDTELEQERALLSQAREYMRGDYKCVSCVVGFQYLDNYNDHMKRKHSDDSGSIVCEVCAQRVATDCDYKFHLLRHYRRYQCVKCEKRFQICDEGIRHYHKVHVEKKFRNNKLKGKFNCHCKH